MKHLKEKSAVVYFTVVAGIAAAIAIFANYMIEVSQRDVLSNINNISRTAIPISLQQLKNVKALTSYVASAEVVLYSGDKKKEMEALGSINYILNTSGILFDAPSSGFVKEISLLIDGKRNYSEYDLDQSWARIKSRVSEHTESVTSNAFKEIEADIYGATESVEKMRSRIRFLSIFVLMISISGIGAVYFIFVMPLVQIENLARNEEHKSRAHYIASFVVQRVKELRSLKAAVTNLHLTMRDNIEIKKSLEEQLKQSSLVAEERADFLASMSHEVRTPLSSITGMIFMLERSELSAEQRKYTTLLAKSCHHLNQIVTRSLDISRLNANKLDLVKEEFQLYPMIRDVVDMIRPVCENKLIQVNLDIDEAVPEYVVGDQVRLKEILINYLNNAVKFTRQGRIDVAIMCLMITKVDVTLRIIVKDSGQGIKNEDIPILFKRFSQSGSRRFAGSGLGLSITAGLAKLMGGSVGVDSVYGEGSLFWAIVVLGLASHPESGRSSNFAPLFTAKALSGAIRNVQENIMTSDCELILCRVNKLAEADSPDALQMWLKHEKAIIKSIGPTAISIGDQIRGYHLPTVCETIRELGIDCTGTDITCVDDRPTVLVIDDTPQNLEFISFLIGDIAQIRVSSTAKRGIEIIESGVRLGLVLMDVSMPDQDGLSALQEIRSKAEHSSLAIMMISASADHELEEKCILLGANDYFDRGNSPEYLKTKVKSYIEHWQ